MDTTSLPFKVGFAAILANSLVAGAAFQISDNAEVFVTAQGSVRFDDNIFQTNGNEVEDVVFLFSPGLELKTGQFSTVNGSIAYKHNFLVYADTDENNSSLADLTGKASWAGAQTTFDANAFYRQLEGNTADFLGSRFGDLVRRDTFGAKVRVEREVAAKSSLAGSAQFDGTDYESAALADSLTLRFAGNYFYKFQPKLDLSAGYEYSTTSVDDRIVGALTIPTDGTSSHFLNVGARGEITPKLNGNVRVGAEFRDDDEVQFAVDGVLSWSATAKTSVDVNMGRRFDTSATATGLTRTTLGVAAKHSFTTQLAGSAEARYELSDNDNGRTDSFYEFSVGGSYSFNENLTASAGYVFRFNNSDEELLDFSNNIVSMSVAFRY